MMENRIIVAGSRTFTGYNLVKKALEQYICEHKADKIIIVSGTANGADKLGERFAEENSIELHRFPANWNFYGKRAGYVRNTQMLDFAKKASGEAVLMAFWDGHSHGTKNMIDIAKDAGITVLIFKFNSISECQN